MIWNDPDLGIPWPVADVTLSDKDRVLPRFAGCEPWFAA